MGPQYWPPVGLQAVTVAGTQAPPPQTPAIPPPPHVCPAGQGVLQVTLPPQPFPMTPQYWPPTGVQLMGVQLAGPHTWGIPEPPQAWPAGQVVPQSSEPPHPSPITPQ
jgi:hypothetical protein